MGQHPSKDQREINTMAFRARDPNTLVPSRSDDPNWRTTSAPNKSNNAVALFDSKAPNAVVGPSPIGGTILQQQGNNQAIVPIQPSPYQATLGQHTSSDDSPNSMPWYRADGLSPIPRRAPFSRMSSFPPPPQQQQPNAFQSRLMSVWDDSVTGHAQANISGNGTLQANQAASSRPPMTNRTNAESASGGLRSGGGGSGYSMAGRQYTASSSISQPRGYGVPPGFASYSAAARSHIPPPPQRKLTVPAFEIYKDYKAEQNQENKLATGPKTLEQYSREIHALSESCDRGSAQQAEFVLRSIIFKFKNGEHDIQPDGACYNSVIHAFAKAGMPHQAENVMRLMFTDYKNGNVTAEPNVRCFTNVLHAWRKSKDLEAPERCEGLIEQMREISSTSNLQSCKPDTFAITVLLHCWVESNREDAADRAEVIFREMKNRFLEGDEGMRPDCISYSILLNTYAQLMKIEPAERMLWEMVNDFLDGNLAAEPRTRNFNTVMAMYSRSDLQDAPDRAEEVLARFLNLGNDGFIRIRPDEYTFALLLKTWTTSGRSNAVETAVGRLEWMRSLYNAGQASAFPDVVKYSTIVAAYAQKGEIGNAAKLLDQMIEDYYNGKDDRVKPDFALFDLVIKASSGASSVSSSDAFTAESILRSMWRLVDDGVSSVRPHASTYKNIIVCFKKAGIPQRAEDFLWEMESKSVGKPYKSLFQTVLNAWHVSRHPDKQAHITTLRLEIQHRFGRDGDTVPKNKHFHGKK